jgi:hypothetical protein
MPLLNTATALYVGDTPASRAYLGPTLVWSPTTPVELTLQPMQPCGFIYNDGDASSAVPYAAPGGLVVAGRENYAAAGFHSATTGGATVLLYLDALVENTVGRYHDLLINDSVYGPAVPRWPGEPQANSAGYLLDFRVGSVLHDKLEDVLELMVSENPHIGGFFADDLGSRSHFPNFDWSTFGATNQQDYRDGAIAVAQTFRTVADRHGLMVIGNGTWGAGSLADDGGGYPDMSTHGCSLLDGGTIEHHDADGTTYWNAYSGGTQWAADSPVTGPGNQVMIVIGSSEAARGQWAAAGLYAYHTTQDSYGEAPAPWASFHPTGLPVGEPAPGVHFIAEYETPGYRETTGTVTRPVTVAAGDTLVVYAISGNSGVGYTNISGGGLTYTSQQAISAPSRTTVQIWTAHAATAQTFDLSVTISTGEFGFNVLRFAGVAGVGASAAANAASGAAQVPLTVSDGSAVVVAIGDWDGADGSTREWLTDAGTLDEQTYYRSASFVTAYGGAHLDVGAAGSKTVGLTAPSFNHSIVAVELLPSA